MCVSTKGPICHSNVLKHTKSLLPKFGNAPSWNIEIQLDVSKYAKYLKIRCFHKRSHLSQLLYLLKNTKSLETSDIPSWEKPHNISMIFLDCPSLN